MCKQTFELMTNVKIEPMCSMCNTHREKFVVARAIVYKDQKESKRRPVILEQQRAIKRNNDRASVLRS